MWFPTNLTIPLFAWIILVIHLSLYLNLTLSVPLFLVEGNPFFNILFYSSLQLPRFILPPFKRPSWWRRLPSPSRFELNDRYGLLRVGFKENGEVEGTKTRVVMGTMVNYFLLSKGFLRFFALTFISQSFSLQCRPCVSYQRT